MTTPITVTAAILIHKNQVFAARRGAKDELAGYWEFPGGKVEPGETEEQCLARELKEELGVECEIVSFFAESIHEYKDKRICLRGYRVRYLAGEFICRVHDEFTWLQKDQLYSVKWAPADIPLVEKVLTEVEWG